MSEKTVFTLKVAAENFPDSGGDNLHHKTKELNKTKVKVLLEFGPEFNSSLESDTRYKANFNPRKVKSLLSFVSNEVMTRVVEHLYREELIENSQEYREIVEIRNKMRAKNKNSSITDLIANGVYSSKELQQHEEIIEKVIKAFLKKNLDKKSRKQVTQVRYQKLSEGAVSYSVEANVNGDLPPPRIPPM